MLKSRKSTPKQINRTNDDSKYENNNPDIYNNYSSIKNKPAEPIENSSMEYNSIASTE